MRAAATKAAARSDDLGGTGEERQAAAGAFAFLTAFWAMNFSVAS